MKKGKGWYNEPLRHSLARKGVKTSKKRVSRSKLAMPRGVAKVDVTLSLAEAKKLKQEMEARGHKCGIDRGVFGYRLWIPSTKQAVKDYNALVGYEALKYSKRHGVLL